MTDKVKWACPKCGAEANGHGKGKCKGYGVHCDGFLCLCDDDGDTEHGESSAKACSNAVCHHCGWNGTFPRPARKLLAWEKKAIEEGWTPPAGWDGATAKASK